MVVLHKLTCLPLSQAIPRNWTKKCETENCAQELAEYSEENKKLVKNCGFVSDRCDNKHKKSEPFPF